MTLGLFIAIGAVIFGVLGLLHVLGVVVLSIVLILVGVLWVVADRPWVRR